MIEITNERTTRPGSGLLWLGLVLGFGSVAAYVVQVMAKWLSIPWYMPIGATVGAIMVAIAFRQYRSWARRIALILAMFLAGASWSFLYIARIPAYSGPVAIGQPFPSFAAQRFAVAAPGGEKVPVANSGVEVTEKTLRGDQSTVLLFFRGRW